MISAPSHTAPPIHPTPEPWAGAARWGMILGSLAYLVLNVLSTQTGPRYGGDASQYVIHALNIVGGLPYGAGYQMPGETFPNYSPGFPLMLAAVIKFFGLNFYLMRLTAAPFWLLCCWALFHLARPRLGVALAALVALFTLFSPELFVFKQQVLSDVPFTGLTLAALWAWQAMEEKGPGPRHWRLGLCAALVLAALFTRPAGMALLGVFLLMLALRRHWIALGLTSLLAGLLYLSMGSMVSAAEGQMGLTPGLRDWLARSYQHGLTKLALIMRFFIPPAWGPAWSQAGDEALRWAAAPILLPPLVVWCRARWRARRLDFCDLFIIAYLAEILIWPWDQGYRFLLPVLGLLLVYCLEGWLALLRGLSSRLPGLAGPAPAWTLAGLLAAVLVYNLAVQAGEFKLLPHKPLDEQTLELHQWMRENMGPQEHFISRASNRPLALYTGRTGASFDPYQSSDERRAKIKRLGVTHIIVGKGRKEEIKAMAWAPKRGWETVFENQAFVVYRAPR